MRLPCLWAPVALGLVVACGASMALAITAIVVLAVALLTVDFRENPRHWDEVLAREKATRIPEQVGH